MNVKHKHELSQRFGSFWIISTIIANIIFFSTDFSGVHNGWRIPLIFVLTTNKTTATYTKIFEIIKQDQPNFNPTQITVDFEMAVIKAAKKAFPNAKIQGCHFHLAKNVVKNLGQHGLKTRYENDIKFAAEIRQLIALAFVPVELVVKTWELFISNSVTLNQKKQKKDANINAFVNDYFMNHYIGKPKAKGKGKGVRGNPPFAIDLWNAHQSSVQGKTLIHYFTH